MSLITVEYAPRGWLWVADIQPTIGYISLGELACQNIILRRLNDRLHGLYRRNYHWDSKFTF